MTDLELVPPTSDESRDLPVEKEELEELSEPISKSQLSLRDVGLGWASTHP